MILEAFPILLRDPGHWEFELFLILVFDVLIGAVAWPFIKRHIHKDVDKAEAHEHEQIGALKQRILVLEGDEAAIKREVTDGRKSPNWARARLGLAPIPSRPPWMTPEEFDQQYRGRFDCVEIGVGKHTYNCLAVLRRGECNCGYEEARAREARGETYG